jgi:hypothetical protein
MVFEVLRMLINIYNGLTIDWIAAVETEASAFFSRSWFDIGEFTIEINKNITGATEFQRDRIVQIGNDIYKAGIITEVESEIGAEGKGSQKMIVKGFELKALFRRRLIWPQTSSDVWAMTDKAETVMKAVISDQCGPTAAAKRQFAALSLTADQARGSDYALSARYDNLGDILTTISQAGDLGWFVTLDASGKQLIFEVGVGVDRRGSQSVNGRAIFSTDYDTLKEAKVKDTDANYANLCIAGGPGTGDERILETVYAGGSEPEDIERVEIFVDASDLETQAGVITRGEGKLTEFGETILVSEAQVLSYSPLKYRTDYDLGDVATLRAYETDEDIRITEIKESWGSQKYEVEIQFGRPYPTILSQVGTLSSRATKTETQKEAGGNITTGGNTGGTIVPEAPVVYALGIFKGIMLFWHRQTNLRNFQYYEVQVSGDYDPAHPELAHWYSLRQDGSDWKDVLDGVTIQAVEILLHHDIPFAGTVDDPLGVALSYRVRTRTFEPATSAWSTVVTATTQVLSQGNLGAGTVFANNLVAGVLQTVIAMISDKLILDATLGYGGQTNVTPVIGALRWIINQFGVQGERYDGAAWQSLIKLGDVVGGNFQPYVRALALLHTNMDVTALDIGTTPPTGAIAYEFENNLTPLSGTTIWAENAGISYVSLVKMFGSYSLSAASYGYLRTAAAAMTLTACGVSFWAFLPASVKGALLASFSDETMGTTWTQQTGIGATGYNLLAISQDGITIYALLQGTPGTLKKSTDGGANWTTLANPAGVTETTKGICCSSDGEIVFVLVDGAKVYKSADGGSSWDAGTSVGFSGYGSQIKISCSGDGMKIAIAPGGTNDYLYLSSDGGATWVANTAGGSKRWTAVAYSRNGNMLVAADGLSGVSTGYVYTSTNDGVNWTARSVLGAFAWGSVSCSADGTKIVAVPTNSSVYSFYYSSDSGATWSTASPGTAYWSDAAVSDNGLDILIGNNSGYLYKSVNGGANWTTLTGSGSYNWGNKKLSGDGQKAIALRVSSYPYTSSALSAGVMWLGGDTVHYYARTASGETSYDVTVTPGAWHHIAHSPQDNDIFGAVDGSSYTVSDPVLSGTGRLTVYTTPGICIDDAAVLVATEYAMADATAHFLAGVKWALIDIEDDLVMGNSNKLYLLASQLLLQRAAGDFAQVLTPVKVPNPTVSWAFLKTTGWTVDNFTTGSLVCDFSAIVSPGTKAILVYIYCNFVAGGNVAARKYGDSNISNTPFASGENSHFIITNGASGTATGAQVKLYLSDDYKCQITVSANIYVYISSPIEEFR